MLIFKIFSAYCILFASIIVFHLILLFITRIKTGQQICWTPIFFWCPTNLLTAYDPPIKIDRIQVNAAILDFWLPGRVDWDLTNALLWYFMPVRMIKKDSKKYIKKTKHFFTKVDSILSLRTKNTSFMIISYQKRRVGCFSFSRD